jgi:hypothetical protein
MKTYKEEVKIKKCFEEKVKPLLTKLPPNAEVKDHEDNPLGLTTK